MRVTLATVLASLALRTDGRGVPLGRRDALSDCLTKAEVPIDNPGGDDWHLDAAPYNLRLNYTPAAIAVPTEVKHIQDAVACAAELGVKTNAKCGGHSYASFGLGGEDGHLVIEMDRMSKVQLGDTGDIASVEGGARLGHVANELYQQGKRGFSHGTCPGVGIAGHALHGGYGLSSHSQGLALDWMVGATVVLANSSVVEVSERQYPDIFWALRGAGSSIGIVSSFRFKTFAVPETLTSFTVLLPWSSQDTAGRGLKAVQDFALNGMPPELNMRVFITGRFVNLEGLYWGSKASMQGVLEPLLNKTGGKFQAQDEGGWMDQIKHFGNGVSLDQGYPYDYHETFYSSSLYTRALSDAQIKSLVSYWFNSAKKNRRSWYLQIDVHGGNTSAVAKPSVHSTAYAHRDYLFMYSFYDRVDRGTFPADGFGYMQNFVANITSGMGRWGQYINYPDSRMTQAVAQDRYWGDHLARLQAIKAQVDPHDVFYYPQGVSPAVVRGEGEGEGGGADGGEGGDGGAKGGEDQGAE